MHPRNLGALLKSSIDPLMPQAKRLLELRQILKDTLPDNLARACSVANVKQGKVVIFAENSAVAAKLKLVAPTLKNRLLESGHEVTGIDVEVQLKLRESTPRTPEHRLTPAAAQELSALADQLPDSALKNVIISLASKVSKD